MPWTVTLPDDIVDEGRGRRPTQGALVLLLSDIIRHGCGASTLASDIPDYFALARRLQRHRSRLVDTRDQSTHRHASWHRHRVLCSATRGRRLGHLDRSRRPRNGFNFPDLDRRHPRICARSVRRLRRRPLPRPQVRQGLVPRAETEPRTIREHSRFCRSQRNRSRLFAIAYSIDPKFALDRAFWRSANCLARPHSNRPRRVHRVHDRRHRRRMARTPRPGARLAI